MLLFLFLEGNVGGGRRDTEGVQDESNQPLRGKHDKHAENTVENLLLSCRSVLTSSFRTDELIDPPEENEESNGEG